MNNSILGDVQQKSLKLWEKAGILDENVEVLAHVLTTEEAIGNPEGDDFPLQRGKEKLMEATFKGEKGQAFTDRFGNFSAPLRDICNMTLDNNFNRAIFIATLNAVQRSLGKAERTVHCRDEGPKLCASQFADYLMDKYGKVRITQIGFQPAMINALSKKFALRVVDLDPDNIGTVKDGVPVGGPEETEDAINDAELLVVTGSTIVNDTLGDFLRADKPTVFFGTTVAGAAELMGWERFCCQSS
ncbi:MAG: DUF364 domain-containing protein [Desulforhopalus sp.]|nr:DUF364 domain-containing protein [Desulforhopalus sp.]